jgi:hypothetical protein
MRTLLVPFVLLGVMIAASAVAAACGDDDDDGGQGGDDGGLPTLTLTARGTLFTTQLLAAGPNREMSFEFVNEDDGQRHNVALFRTEIGGDPIFRVEPTIGKTTTRTPFTTPAVGTYYYRCQFHPEAMRGDLVITQR